MENDPGQLSESDIHRHRVLEEEQNGSIYLSIVWYSGRLGAAYYDSFTSIIHLLTDTEETGEFTLIHKLIDELKPRVIITSARQDERFVQVLSQLAEASQTSKDKDANQSTSTNSSENGDDNLLPTNGFTLEILSSIEYLYESSKRRIISVNLPSIPKHFDNLEREMYMSTIVPFNSICTVRSTGGLLKYLDKNRVSVELEGADVQTPVSGFQTFNFKHILHLDKVTYDALQIFHRVCHPSAMKTGSKEGLSLFAVLNRTTTRMGLKLLKSWFYRPMCDAGRLNERLDAVGYFVDPKNDEIASTMKDCLRCVKNVSRMLSRMKTSKLSVLDWRGLCRTSQSAIRIADTCRSIAFMPQHSKMPVVFERIIQTFTQELVEISNSIINIMDMEASVRQNKFVVKPGISEPLDKMRETYARLPAILAEVANQDLAQYAQYISSCQIVYMRHIGYLLFTTKTEAMKESNDFQIPGMEFIAESNATLYYKTPATQQLDESYGDILEDIDYQHVVVANNLQDEIYENAAVLINVMRYVAELDCILSFATAAKELNYVRPVVSNSGEIKVIGGRHPLQEHTVSAFVPNNVHFGTEHGFIKIMTGPNASGKSVFLKQVGLIVFMAQIGSFVPAVSATFGLRNRMFTRIRSHESISNDMSTFAVDLEQMSSAINGTDCKSLVLIDEFGKGTATVDGVSLLASCLSHWIKMAESSPMVVCATHFHSLVRQSLLPTSPLVRYQTMDTIHTGDNETVFLYQLKDGVSGKSYAAHVALLAGVPKELVERGREVCETMRQNAPVRPYNQASTFNYQKTCEHVTELALNTDMDNTIAVESLLRDVANLMEAPKKSTETPNNASASASSSFETPENRPQLYGLDSTNLS